MDDDHVPLFLAFYSVLFIGVLTAAALALEEEEYYSSLEEVSALIAQCLLSGRRKRRSNRDEGGRVVRRRYVHWDRERAYRCILQDYLGPSPSFGVDDFKRIFRVSRSSYEDLKSFLCERLHFFREGLDVTRRVRVGTDAKLLIALKYLAYGCSVNSFRDYFQIGESTAMECVKRFVHAIADSPFQKKYFSFYTAADARRVESLHFLQHGVHGMLGSLDCSHFVWGNCPVAHHGQFQGKEGRPTIVVEALADYNLFVWHAVFGYSGTLNDISIWDSSYLLQSLCDGSFAGLDFSFTIAGEWFHQLWFLVDGIYPPLARFVKPISVPIGKAEALFSMWQESKRKDIERFFGVFKRKFFWFNRPIPFAYMNDIIKAFYCCVILHNMAVVERVNAGEDEVESDGFYDCVPDPEAPITDAAQPERLALQFVRREADAVRERILEVEYLSALGINVLDSTIVRDRNRLEV